MYITLSHPCTAYLFNNNNVIIQNNNNNAEFFNNIIIIQNGQQCKSGRERFTPYQFEDPSPAIPTYRQEEKKRKNSRRQKGSEQLGQ